MLKGLFRIVIVILAIIGSVAILLVWLNLMNDNDSDYVVQTRTPSPGGGYVAVLSEAAGGWVTASYCYDRLTVVPTGAPANTESARDMAVFEGACASFPRHGSVVESSPSVHWESDTKLEVDFSVNETALVPATVTLSKQDASGNVSVEFKVLP